MIEQLTLWSEEPKNPIQESNEPRCGYCTCLLDSATVVVGFCTSECEREASQQ